MAETSVAHAHEAHDQGEGPELWEGGKPPFKASYGKLMMWYFLVSDAFTFAGFLIAYGALRFSMPTWPEPDFVFASFPFVKAHWPLIFVTFMTFVLIFSSVTMVRAVQEGHRENRRGVVFWMILTILGGATFLGSQAYEWTTLIVHENVSVRQNPFGRHIADGVYLNDDGTEAKKPDGTPDTFHNGESYLLHTHKVTQPDGTVKEVLNQIPCVGAPYCAFARLGTWLRRASAFRTLCRPGIGTRNSPSGTDRLKSETAWVPDPA